MSQRRSVELVQTRALTPSVRAFTWRCVDGAALPYTPGQWMNFYVPAPDREPAWRRAYSIASAPDPIRPDTFDIAVTHVRGGHASRVLHGLTPGAVLEMDGAHGFFTRESARGEPALFVGTGTGVCPLRAMIEEELRADAGPAIELLFGCRTEEEILYREDFERWARERPRFAWRATLSQPAPDWQGARGYVQTHLPEVMRGPRRHVYVCGLQKMIKEVRRVLKDDLGVERRLIHSERYD